MSFDLEILRAVKTDLPDIQFYTANDHRLLAAYYAKAFNLEPLDAAVYVHRAVNPTSRAEHCVHIYDNTGCRKSYTCAVCGGVLGQHSAKWRRTKKSYWEVTKHEDYEIFRINGYTQLLGDYNPKLAMLRYCLSAN